MTAAQLKRMEQGRRRALAVRRREQRQAVQEWRAWLAKASRRPFVQVLHDIPVIPRDEWYDA